MINNKKQLLNHQIVVSIKAPIKQSGLPLITLTCGGVPLTFLLDTGSTHCLINSGILSKIPYTEDSYKISMYGVDGKKTEKKRVKLKLDYNDYSVYEGLFTSTPLKFPKVTASGKTVNVSIFHGILGLPFLQATGARINYRTLKAYINGLSRNIQSEIQVLQRLSADELAEQPELLELAEELTI